MSTKVCVLCLIVTQAIYCQYNSSNWIERALQEWELSSTEFYRPAMWSIVGHDKENGKVIIFGGATGIVDIARADWYSLYIYDLIKDELISVPIKWNLNIFGELQNQMTTNAVIINGTMYFATRDHILSLKLDPIYAYNNGSQSSDIQPKILLNHSSSIGYVGQGCLVTDETKNYLIISGMFRNYGDVHNSYYKFESSFDVGYYNIKSRRYRVGAFTTGYHQHGVCTVMNNVLYIIGGYNNKTDYIDIQQLIKYEDYDQYPDDLPYLNHFADEMLGNPYRNIQNEHPGSAVINDDENGLIYILGGDGVNHDVYRINEIDQTVLKLNIVLPYGGIAFSTAILSNKTKRIYVFRGLQGWDSQRIAFTKTLRRDVEVYAPQSITNSLETQHKGDNNMLVSMLIVLIISIGLICIFGTIVMGLYLCKQIKSRQKQEQLMQSISPHNNDTDTDLDDTDIL